MLYPDNSAVTNDSTPSAATAGLADTAFRKAEKRYQLHLQTQQRIRKGRLRAGKLVAQPTDLSDVVDVRNPRSTDVISVRLQPCCRRSSTLHAAAALLFSRHTGLVVFPAAVQPDLQLQLIHAALEEWPEAPARTNHTRVYGSSLRQLFQAAQLGLHLTATSQQVSQQDTGHQGEHSIQARQQEQHHIAGASLGGLEHLPTAQQGHHHPQQTHAAPEQQQLQQEPGTVCQLRDQRHTVQDHSSSGLGSIWSDTGKGPAAAQLLRKLRWVCLGPPYNWTDRIYEAHLPHRPLPQALLQLACCCAAASVQVQAAVAGADSTAAATTAVTELCGSQKQRIDAPAQQQQRTEGSISAQPTAEAAAAAVVSDSTAAAGTLAAACWCAACSTLGGAPYTPDAALVNYYHSGDTLNGHKDDVERDLSQPIVTISLGCEAVFLVGGETRDVEPTALLLRSGDIVVMGQAARASYHGLPRVLTDRPLPAELLQAAQQHGQQYQAHIRHMSSCRVNISIRATQ